MTPAKIAFAAALISLFAMPALAAGDAGAGAGSGAGSGTEAADPVTKAEADVEAARAVLRDAIAKGKGISSAREVLRKTLHRLDLARAAAGLPPATDQPGDAAPPAAAPGGGEPGGSEPPADQPPADIAPPTDQPSDLLPPADEPPAEIAPPADQPTTIMPPADQQPPDIAPPSDQAPPAPGGTDEQPPPAPPPAADMPTFDLNNFRNRPVFGQMPPTLPSELPSSGDSIKEGGEIAAPGGSTIEKQGGQIIINSDDANRVRQQGDGVSTVDSGNGTTTETIKRRNGTEIVTVRGSDGSIVQRYRRNADGSTVMLIGSGRDNAGSGSQRPPALNLNLGPLQITIPDSQYIVDSSTADTRQLEQALAAPPVETVERAYSLEEIRRSGRLRDKLRRIDFDTITFNTGQATVPNDQIGQMQSLGTALRALIQKDPSQVFLIEGHTDAVGSDVYNLALSDRRAQTVAEILSYYFGIPPENMVTQGYGEQFLKIPTTAANRDNRRVAFRNITYLLRASR